MSKAFAQGISLLRRSRGLSQREVSGGLGISQALLSHYENARASRGWTLSRASATTTTCRRTICWDARTSPTAAEAAWRTA